jgi:cytochrome c-type biogenesis protein CcmH
MKAILVVLSLLLAAPVLAAEPSEMLDNPALEQRVNELSAEILCVVCKNESIDSSNAEIEHELGADARALGRR